jgi:hypothetical protein
MKQIVDDDNNMMSVRLVAVSSAPWATHKNNEYVQAFRTAEQSVTKVSTFSCTILCASLACNLALHRIFFLIIFRD